MRKIFAAMALLLAAPAAAQVIPTYAYPSVGTPPMVQLQCSDTYTACLPITSTNPVPSAALATANATAGTAPNATAAASGSLIAKASSGNLYGVNVTSGASSGYVMIFSRATVPADGAVTPQRCIPLAANTGLELNYRPVPVNMPAGIVIVFSTTGCFTQTISATAFISADAK